MVHEDLLACTAFVGAVWEMLSNVPWTQWEKRGANTIQVTLEHGSNRVKVEDDGYGFPLEHVVSKQRQQHA